MAPLIGISGRRLSASIIGRMDPRFARREFDFFFSDYARCVAEAGGIPVHLPYEADGDEVVPRLDGVIITGGQDIHPARWGGDTSVVPPDADPRMDSSAHDAQRDGYESSIIAAAMRTGVPLLGVCRGHQMLNVALGGTLVADLPPSEVEHYLKDAPLTDGRADHVVRFAPGSLVESIYGREARLNSWHHQSVARCGTGLEVTGWADDGIVESIEVAGRPVLGVQWHPEWQLTPDPVFAWLIEAAQAHQHHPLPNANLQELS
ncbi:gamma-glutamyl-gamma-aminobutyrate hydrolase family protein [Nocardioides hungaricus]